jgi:hypothetical protein
MFSWSSNDHLNSSTNNSDASSNVWKMHKESGKSLFLASSYTQALGSYQAALDSNPPDSERSILLSNIIACRLKLIHAHASGDNDDRGMVEAAIEEAKMCIEASDGTWPKAYVRLASAYMALGEWEERHPSQQQQEGTNDNDTNANDTNRKRVNSYSNDVCNALQKALQLDTNYAVARKMLVQELRRRNNPNAAAPMPSRSQSYSHNGGIPSAPPQPTPSTSARDDDDIQLEEDEDDRENSTSSTRPTSSRNDHNNDNNNSTNDDDGDGDVDDGFTLQQRIQFYTRKIQSYFSNHLSEEWKSLLKVMLALIILYVAFGGRFGLDYILSPNSKTLKGHYGDGNAYDQYYKRSSSSSSSASYGRNYDDYPYNDNSYSNRKSSTTTQRQQQQEQQYNSYSNSGQYGYNNNNAYDSTYSSHGSYGGRGRRRSSSRGYSSSSFPSFFGSGGQSSSIAPMFIITFIIFGINYMTGNNRRRRRAAGNWDGGGPGFHANDGVGGVRNGNVHFNFGAIGPAIVYGVMRQFGRDMRRRRYNRW